MVYGTLFCRSIYIEELDMAKGIQPNGDEKKAKGMRRVPRWFWTSLWIAGSMLVLGVVILGLFWISRFLDTRVSDPIQFITGNLLNVLLFVVILFQTYIYRRQTRIMGVAYDPRLQITSVRVVNLKPEEEPIFIVSVKNIGAIDARGVVVNLRVSFGRPVESILAQKLSEPQTVTIAAGQEQTYAIPWDQPVKQGHIDRLNKVPLIVSGFIKLRDEKEREFCYRYYPLKGERPPGVPEFIPCDFDIRLTRIVTPGTAGLKVTAQAAIAAKGEVVPTQTETQNKESAKNPN